MKLTYFLFGPIITSCPLSPERPGKQNECGFEKSLVILVAQGLPVTCLYTLSHKKSSVIMTKILVLTVEVAKNICRAANL